ncbi:hypothetical protein GQ53DRAFT_200138 [Thozetella sp. PMI_491]|nr:hypothetical protein GQ53DRAFT_200138 [Thozetella sp. PMI_491]
MRLLQRQKKRKDRDRYFCSPVCSKGPIRPLNQPPSRSPDGASTSATGFSEALLPRPPSLVGREALFGTASPRSAPPKGFSFATGNLFSEGIRRVV